MGGPTKGRSRGTILRHAGDALEGNLKPVVWITAPAGSGKSVFAKQICRRSGGVCIWLRAEPRMADMGMFLTSLESAFRNALAKRDLPALASQDIAYPVDYLRRLIAAGSQDSRITIVLDDLHGLPADAPLHQALADAIADDTGDVRLILVSRETPHPAWLRFNAAGKVVTVDFNTLKLSEAEASELMIQLGGDCGGWTASSLVQASGGWMLGACLLLQSAMPRKVNDAADLLSPDSTDLFNLIVHELIEPLSDTDRTMLCRMARLPNLPVRIVAHALGLPRGDKRLVRLANRLLFVERDGRDRLQIHDLLKAALRHHYSDLVDEGKAAELATRAGKMLLEDGDVGEGLLLLSSSAAWAALKRAVIEHAPALSEQGELGVILTALEPMPEAERETNLTMRYWYAAALLNVNPIKARELLTPMLETARRVRANELLIPIWTTLADAIWLEWMDCSLFDPLIEMLPELAKRAKKQGPTYEAMLARGAFAAMSFRCPDHKDFSYWEQRNLDFYGQRIPRHETIRRGIHLLFRYCYGEGHRWKADQVRTRLNQVFDEETASVADICTRYVVTAEFLSIFDASGDETFRALEMGIEANARHQQTFWDGTLINAALFKALSLEDRERARRYLGLLAARLGPHAHPNHVAFHQHFSAWNHWLDGEREAALALLLPAYRTAERSGMAMFPVHYGNAVAAVLQSLGRRREALAWLRRSRRAAERQSSPLLVFLSGLRGASLALTSANPERAKPYLRAALAAGAIMRFYLHAWTSRSEMAALMRFAILNDIEADYARELIRVLGLAGEMPPEADLANVQIVSLGRFDVLQGGGSRLTSGKLPRSPIALAVHLIAAGPEGEASEALADRLWPDLNADEARKRMKSTVYRLRQMVGTSEAIVTAGGRISFDPEHVSIDAWELMTLATAPGWTAEARHAEALRLYRGPFVYHYADDTGLISYEHKLEEAAIEACTAFVRALSVAGDWSRALRVSREGLERLGFRETLHDLATEAAEHLGVDFDAGASDVRLYS
ncbi:BTAD domain-containing putative transcriptional regulator [Nitratireductor kimnyeongensis]|uniref:BTAD domain-containing putative transcriptional regulator n=1 Tax=Nitratireductor kimnyeongensis TaxID=430679 RepID=A0ABW0T7R9_9HYPH|nr:BTAD domain-containing putative transcriptional regulator [Nitratireductor kimnyeongensis]QZZ34038.1 hypothetical protein KW403_09335 [Nitratireductor kimnyeongensis]